MLTQADDPESEYQSLSATERAVAAIWNEVLQTTQLPSAADNFFELGGDSMTMTMVEFRIQEELSIEIPPGSILVAPSLRELSAIVDRTIANSSGAQPQRKA